LKERVCKAIRSLLNGKNLDIACGLASVIDKKSLEFLFNKVKLPWTVRATMWRSHFSYVIKGFTFQ